jgi:hypothetical protein
MSAAALKSTNGDFQAKTTKILTFLPHSQVTNPKRSESVSCVKTLEPNISSFNKDETEIKCDVSTLTLEAGWGGL